LRRKLQKHIERVHALAKKRGTVPESRLLKAMRLLTYSPEKGFKFLQRLEVTYSPNADVYYNMGVALLRLNKLEVAARYFEKTLQLEADHKCARENLDLIVRTKTILNKKHTEADLEEMGTLANYAREGELFDLAKKIGDIMVDVDKEKTGALNDLGLTFQAQKEFDEAIKYYDKALEIEPDMFEALSNKAFCMMITNRYDEAYRLYKRSIELRIDFLQGWYHLGYINIERGNYAEALNCLDKALELNDEYYLAWFAKYELLTKMKRTEEAERCLNKATELNFEFAAQLALGEGEKVHTTNMHAKPRKTV
jgi:tetratricopeptide (TPR) repeat protein